MWKSKKLIRINVNIPRIMENIGMKKYASKNFMSISMKEGRHEITTLGFLISKGLAEGVSRIVQPSEGCIWRQWTKTSCGEGNICLIMANDLHIKIIDVYYAPTTAKELLVN